jgi:hypothetical protein
LLGGERNFHRDMSRPQGPDGGLDGFHVIGRRAAATSHHFGSGLDEFPRVGGHVFRRAQVEISPIHRTGLAGVGLHRDGPLGDLHHPLQAFQHDLGPHAAVDADHVGAPFIEPLGENLRSRSVKAVPVFFDGHLGDDGK